MSPTVNWEGTVEAIGASTPAESTKSNTVHGRKAGEALAATSEQNVAIGEKALEKDTTGAKNTAVGAEALEQNTTGFNNTAIGSLACAAQTAGITANTAVGAEAGRGAEVGGNVFMGYQAAKEAATGEKTVVIGTGAGIKAAKTCVYVGDKAGAATTGNGNVFIGAAAGETEGAVSNKLIISNNAATTLIKGVMSETAASNELSLVPTGGKLGFYGVTPVSKAAEIKAPGTFKTGVSGFETEAECKAIRDKLTTVIEALKGIGICL